MSFSQFPITYPAASTATSAALSSSSSSSEPHASTSVPTATSALLAPPFTPWSPAPDDVLDDVELDLALNGYEPVDNLEDVEVGSDDFDILVVPVPSDEECPSEEEQESALKKDEEPYYAGHRTEDAANWEVVHDEPCSETAGYNTDDTDTEEETNIDERSLSSDADRERDGDVTFQQDTEEGGPRGATPQVVTPIARTIATRSRTQRSLKRVRYADSDGQDQSDFETDESDVRRPAAKKARRKYSAQAQGLTRRTRMTKAQATSLWTRDDAVCGMDGCEHTVNRAGSGWKRHLDAVHYVAQASSDDERGERTPMVPAAATSSRGANQATSAKKAKTTRKGNAKSKSQRPNGPTCLHADCEEDREFTTTDILYRHIQTVHWKWTFSCPSCGQAFTRLPNMKKHLSAGHSGDELPVPEDDP